jgi:hypothetical protein
MYWFLFYVAVVMDICRYGFCRAWQWLHCWWYQHKASSRADEFGEIFLLDCATCRKQFYFNMPEFPEE